MASKSMMPPGKVNFLEWCPEWWLTTQSFLCYDTSAQAVSLEKYAKSSP